MNQIAYEDFTLFMSALKFGAHKHRWQRRKDAEQTPYFNHPINVAEVLWGSGAVRDITILTAALLHDVIEDTETLPDEVERDFGKVVRSLILEVTDDKSLPKETRKELQVQHAPHLSPGAKLIKIADKICNIKDVIYSPPPNWSIERRLEYLAWAERVVKAMNGCNERLEEEFYRLLKEGRERLGGSRWK
ncbi:MAG: HD domain-containing protein [Syntrophobacteraceae bacterium]|nr:HD domain-containing protein [Syntrophobacteraceae bacterium]